MKSAFRKLAVADSQLPKIPFIGSWTGSGPMRSFSQEIFSFHPAQHFSDFLSG